MIKSRCHAKQLPFYAHLAGRVEDQGMSSGRIAVVLEVTQVKTVASAINWPGWCRVGRDDGTALEALASYAVRYAPVADQAGFSFPSIVAYNVVERLPGGPTTRLRRA
jgi:hypothetical protein